MITRGLNDETKNFDDYLRSFDYDERLAIKIQLPEMLKLYAEDKAQIIDIRFDEEYAAWRVGNGFYQEFPRFPDNSLTPKYQLLDDQGRYRASLSSYHPCRYSSSCFTSKMSLQKVIS